MFNLFGKKKETVAPETVSKAEHDRIVADMAATIADKNNRFADLHEELRIERDTVERLVIAGRAMKDSLTAARAEAEANRVDAEAHRRSKANLKQFRSAANG